MSAELSSIKRRELVKSFLQTLFPPGGIGMGTAEMDILGAPFEKRLGSVETNAAVSQFIDAVNGSKNGAAIAAMKTEINAAFDK